METSNERRKRIDVTNTQYGKLPPQNIQAEEAILGQLLNGSGRIVEVAEILPDADRFYKDDNQRIYAAILACHQKSQGIDPIVVITELTARNDLEMAGGAYAIFQKSEKIAMDHTLLAHAHAISEAYKRRCAIKTAGELLNKAYDPSEEIDSILHQAENELLNTLSEGDTSECYELRDCAVEFLDNLHNAQSNKQEVTGINTGYGYLNSITSGWQNGELIILAARPAVGKTAFALNLALNPAFYYSTDPVGLFSLEMSKKQLMQRLVSNVSMIELTKIKRGELEEIELNHVTSSLDRLIKAPIVIEDTFSLNILQLRARAKRMKRKFGIKLLIVDYLQLMAGTSKSGNREQEISQISRGLKGIAKELDIPVIALSQLSRAVETRGGDKGKVPQLSDLRESGAIEQDADIVMFIYNGEDADTGEVTNFVSIAKNRQGETGLMEKCKFFAQIQKWMNPADSDAYEGKTGYKAHAITNPDFQHESSKSLSLHEEGEAPF